MHRERWQGVNFTARAGDGDEKAESPIETKLLQALRGWMEFAGVSGFVLRAQVKVGPYRADIMIEDQRADYTRKLVVECDGREFHNSEQQVERDKRRDRWFAANDMPVMRFTGSEIHRDARGCAAQIGQWMEARL